MRITSLALLCILAFALGGATQLVAFAGPVEREIRYPIDTAALRDEFNRTGAVTLKVPDLGLVVVEGERTGSREGSRYSMMRPNGTVEFIEHPSISLGGSVPGVPGSEASLLLGQYAVYGGISLPGYHFNFNPHFEPDARTFTQEVRLSYPNGPPKSANVLEWAARGAMTFLEGP